MSRRFLVIALVFAVGFGVGYGATWLVVGSPDKAPATVAGTPETREPATKPATAETTAATAPAATDAPPTAEADAGAATAPSEADAAIAAVDSEALAVEPDVAEAPDVAVAVEPEVAPPAAATWWDACKGKVCGVDWGKVSGGISVREGELEHGAEVDWASTYAKAEKVGTLEAKKGMKVEVYAVGLSEGKPVAAWIKYKNLKGVIALSFGDKSISFKPPAE